jgi:CTP synthase (UTP-ammonia lyase)
MTTDIYTTIAKEKLIETLITKYKVNPKYKEDLIQEIYLIVLQKPPDLLQELYDKNQINYFLAKIITNQYFSKTSKFYKDYKKYNSIKDNDTDTTKLEIIDE